MIIGLNRGKPAWYPAKSARSRERILRHAAITCPRETLAYSRCGTGYAAACVPHNVRVAIRAPSAKDFSFAHMIVGWTRRANGLCAKPQSVPAMTFSRPTILGQPDDALGNEFRVLDDIGGMADHAGDETASNE